VSPNAPRKASGNRTVKPRPEQIILKFGPAIKPENYRYPSVPWAKGASYPAIKAGDSKLLSPAVRVNLTLQVLLERFRYFDLLKSVNSLPESRKRSL
jgi:hypothetical protein